MINAPKISIVTISYNQGEFLEEAITSALFQNYSNLEYIVIDGGSTDESLEIIKKYEPQITYWVSESDKGPADALNKGFSKATGDIFYYLNADDVLLPGSLKKIANVLKKHPAADVYYGNAFLTDERLKIKGLCISDHWDAPTYLAGKSIVIQQGTFIRKEAYDKTQAFNVKNRTCWDSELVVDLYLTGSTFYFIDDYFAFFRIHQQSITGSKENKWQYLEDKKRMREKSPINKTFLVKQLKKRMVIKVKRKLSNCVFR